jgi:hypothetical protein
LILCSLFSLVRAEEVQPLSTDHVVMVRGQESVVEELNMGPNSTVFWRSLQSLIEKPQRIFDFADIADLFHFSITQPVDYINEKSVAPVSRFDIKDNYYYAMRSISYGIAFFHGDARKKFLSLYFTLDANAICISSSEVEARYGKGRTAVMMHGDVPSSFASEPIGLRFSEVYGQHDQAANPDVVLTFSPGGCLYSVNINQSIG